VLVGEDPASQVYVRTKSKATTDAGMLSIERRLPADTPERALLALIAELNGRTMARISSSVRSRDIDSWTRMIEHIDPAVELGDQRQQGALGCVGRQPALDREHAGVRGRLRLVRT